MAGRQRSTAGRSRHLRVVVVAAMAATLPVLAATPAQAAISVRSVPSTQSPITVGDTGVPATLTLRNESTAPDNTVAYNVESLRFAPSCAAASSTTCTTPDPGVLATSPTGTGRAGTVCAGTTFTFGPVDGAGVSTVSWPGTITLGIAGGGSDTCIVDFTVRALKMPTIDARPDLNGTQTRMVGFIHAVYPGPGVPAEVTAASGFAVTVAPGDPVPTPPPADFDGDGDTDISVFRPSQGAWLVQGQPTVFLGLPGDRPVPCDYDGDGDVDRAVFRPSVGGWYRQGQPAVFFGLDGDIPVPADYDGDGDCDVAVFRPSVGGWYVQGASPVFLGLSGDIPVPGDYTALGPGADIAVFRPSVGGWYIQDSSTVFFGLSGDIPVPADYDGDGDGDIGVFRPAVGGWYVQGPSAPVFLGLSGDIPVPGDYQGSDAAEVAVFRPSTGAWFVGGAPAVFFGVDGDLPLPLPDAIRRSFFP